MGGPSSPEKSVSGRSYEAARKNESAVWIKKQQKRRGKAAFGFSRVTRPQKPFRSMRKSGWSSSSNIRTRFSSASIFSILSSKLVT